MLGEFSPSFLLLDGMGRDGRIEFETSLTCTLACRYGAGEIGTKVGEKDMQEAIGPETKTATEE